MEERTIIISCRDLVDHTVLTRKKNELQFKKDLLQRSGAKNDDLHIKAIEEEMLSVETKLMPINEKLSIADLLTVIPNRKEITSLSKMINKYTRPELESAVKTKSGEVYELMKKRAVLVKNNYEKREDIARLTINMNTIPRKDAEKLCELIEEGIGEDVDVSSLTKEKQQEVVNLAYRIGRQCCICSGLFTADKKKIEFSEMRASDEVLRTMVGGRQVWVEAPDLNEFEKNEKEITFLLSKIQAKNAEKHARTLSDEENLFLDQIQRDYLEALKRREKYIKNFELKETAKVDKKNTNETLFNPENSINKI